MPIYKGITQDNLELIDHEEIQYFDEQKVYAKEQFIVHLGSGDVLMSNAQRRNNYCDELTFMHQPSQEIGSKTARFKDKPTIPPVTLVFDRPESVQVLIDELSKLKKGMEEKIGLSVQDCSWCAKGDIPELLDDDGVKSSISGNPGVLSHAYDDAWWHCPTKGGKK